MSLLTRLTEEMKSAMRAQDKARLSAIRMLVSAIKYALVDKPDMSEADEILILTKEAKKRRESVEAYRNAGREEQAQAEEYELKLIQSYLPKMMSEDEVRAKLMTLGIEGKNMGEAMKLAMSELSGKADGGVVSRIVREILG